MNKKFFCYSVLVLGLVPIVLADNFSSGRSSSDFSNTTDYNPGIYFGGQFGISDMHYRRSLYTKTDSSYDNKYLFATRGYLGYAFSQFISLELAYNYWGHPKFQHTSGNNQHIVQHGMDIMVKANLPLDYGFSFYTKGGISWVYRSSLHPNGGTFVDKSSNSKFPPTGAIGASYWFDPNFALDLCWTKPMTIGDLPTAGLFSLGFIYKINI